MFTLVPGVALGQTTVEYYHLDALGTVRSITNQNGSLLDVRNYLSTMLLVLASAIMPLARVTIQRTREAEFRHALREMRTAIDKFKDAADLGQIGALDIKVGSENYPPDLETLVEGVSAALDALVSDGYMRKVPDDPFTMSSSTWQSIPSEPDPSNPNASPGVWDVKSGSDATALDGSKYADW